MRQSLTRGGMGGQELKQQSAVARATKGTHAMKSWLSSAVQSGIGSTGTGASSSLPSSLRRTRNGCMFAETTVSDCWQTHGTMSLSNHEFVKKCVVK